MPALRKPIALSFSTTVIATTERLDERVARQAALSRNCAAGLIRAGQILLNAAPAMRPGQRVAPGDAVEVVAPPRFVSRGGEKLAAALTAFSYDPRGVRALDVGISTGGFTDCLLQAGAVHVTGVDVGHDQLSARLRNHPALTLHEGVNARELTTHLPQLLEEPFACITIDISFISLRYVLPEIARVLRPDGTCIALVKPQFEVGRERLGRDGVVRDIALHEEVLASIRTFAERCGFLVRGVCESPIFGSHGNREFLLHLVPQDLGS